MPAIALTSTTCGYCGRRMTPARDCCPKRRALAARSATLHEARLAKPCHTCDLPAGVNGPACWGHERGA